MAARKPTTKAKDKSALSGAMDHVELCCHGVASYAPYCLFAPGWLVGYDGVVAAGYRIAEDLHIAPHTETIRTALARAGNPYSLTVLGSGNVVVTGHKVRVEVPCCQLQAIPNTAPDAPRVAITEPLREALIAASKITKARQERILAASVLLRTGSCVGTDGGTILEAWHGLELPGRWMVPTEFILALEKVKHQPTNIGWSDDTLTVWFGPDVWLRTNCYPEKYPDTDVFFARMISMASELRPVPQDMLQALETLKPFLHDDTITLWRCGFNTKSDGTGASYNFDHHMPPEPRVLPYAAMRFAGMYGEWIGFSGEGMYWYGKTVRGITAAQCS